MFLLIFATAVASVAADFGYANWTDLMPYSVGAFALFGLGALPAGRLGDLWGRRIMMIVFFVGMGAAAVLVSFTQNAWQLAAALTLMGAFAAIYHPVGIAMLVAAPKNLGAALGWNGLWGNLGLAFAAIVSGALMDLWGWRAAFFVPGLAAIGAGIAFVALVPDPGPVPKRSKTIGLHLDARTMAQIFAILLIATACGGVIFNSTTVAMPKVFDERLRALTQTNFGLGALVAFVYSIAAFAQVVMGSLIDRFEMKRLMIGVGLVQIPLLAAAASLDGWPMLVVALGMMMAIFGQIPINDAIVGRYVADEYRSRVFSVRYVVSLGVAAVGVPLISILHRTDGGFRNVFLVLAALACVVMAAALFFPGKEKFRRAPSAAPAS